MSWDNTLTKDASERSVSNSSSSVIWLSCEERESQSRVTLSSVMFRAAAEDSQRVINNIWIIYYIQTSTPRSFYLSYDQSYFIQMENTASKQKVDLIEGALWGAVLGDVIGAHLQFDKDVTQLKVDRAFKVVGGGKHNLEPGQPTDDSELNFSVLKGLSRSKNCLNLNLVAEEMGNWFLSKPIDVGNTIRNAVPKACNMKVHQAHLCRKGAFQRSQTSQSNGTLMGLIGLAVWCHCLPPEDIVKAVTQYTILVHPNQLVSLSNCFYALMVRYLLNNPQATERGRRSFQYAKQYLLSVQKNPQFAEWIQIIEESFEDVAVLQKHCPINKASGWVRVALSYSTHFLVVGKSFKSAIEWIIFQKGDTDTNACIMGGLLGSLYGLKKLEMDAQIGVIKAWTSKRRPEWLHPGKVIPVFVEMLASRCPGELKVVGGSADYPPMGKK